MRDFPTDYEAYQPLVSFAATAALIGMSLNRDILAEDEAGELVTPTMPTDAIEIEQANKAVVDLHIARDVLKRMIYPVCGEVWDRTKLAGCYLGIRWDVEDLGDGGTSSATHLVLWRRHRVGVTMIAQAFYFSDESRVIVRYS